MKIFAIAIKLKLDDTNLIQNRDTFFLPEKPHTEKSNQYRTSRSEKGDKPTYLPAPTSIFTTIFGEWGYFVRSAGWKVHVWSIFSDGVPFVGPVGVASHSDKRSDAAIKSRILVYFITLPPFLFSRRFSEARGLFESSDEAWRFDSLGWDFRWGVGDIYQIYSEGSIVEFLVVSLESFGFYMGGFIRLFNFEVKYI